MKNWLIGKDPDAGKDWGQEEKGTIENEMASSTRWTLVWVDSRSWWWTGRPGILRFIRSQRVGHNWATEQQRAYKSLWVFLFFSESFFKPVIFHLSDPTPIFHYYLYKLILTFLLFSVQFSHSVVSNSLQPHGLQQSRLPCPSPTPEVSTHVHWVGDDI